MDNYLSVAPETSADLECLSEIYNLFALFDTPVNVLFVAQFLTNIKEYKDIFKRYNAPENIFFSCKSNKSFALLKYACDQKCGVEVSSNYELIDALKYSKNVIASGPAKNEDYLENAIKNDVLISVDDIEELKLIKSFNKKVRVLLRLSNLLKIVSRFGINISDIDKCLDIISDSKIELEGFAFHINNYNLDDRVNAIKETIKIINEKNLKVKFIDIGGGIPTNYCSKEDYERFIKGNNKKMYFKEHFIKDYYPYHSDIADSDALDYIFKNTNKILKENNIELIIEPGRSLLKNVGISIYEIEYLKELYNGEKILVTNGNINTLSEQWFNSDYLIEPKLITKEPRKEETIYASIAGNLCLEQDMLTWRKIKFNCVPKRGDLLIYFNTAGYQMDSNESEFHKIPLVKKVIIEKINNEYKISEDKEYDSK
jgi:diaminopimelate decarboxylase